MVSNNLRILAQELEVSLFTVLLAAYYLLLSVYSNQKDIVVGIPIANRHYKQLEPLIGCFIYSIPVRITINPQVLIKDLIQEIASEFIEIYKYLDLPFEELLSELNIPKDTSVHPIFRVMFSLQRFGGTINSGLMEIYKPINHFYKIAKFDISTFIDDSEVCIKGMFNYSFRLYKDITIQNFIDTYSLILEQCANLTQESYLINHFQVCDLVYLTHEQQKVILNPFVPINNIGLDRTKTISQLFEEQVLNSPNSTAVKYKDTELTYNQLNEKANQLAHYLRIIYQITPDSLVAICLDRNENMLISILAILKSGGAYGRWLQNGEIEYIGRNDSQVKINGYRIRIRRDRKRYIKL